MIKSESYKVMSKGKLIHIDVKDVPYEGTHYTDEFGRKYQIYGTSSNFIDTNKSTSVKVSMQQAIFIDGDVYPIFRRKIMPEKEWQENVKKIGKNITEMLS